MFISLPYFNTLPKQIFHVLPKNTFEIEGESHFPQKKKKNLFFLEIQYMTLYSSLPGRLEKNLRIKKFSAIIFIITVTFYMY